MAFLFPVIQWQYNGSPLALGQIYTYQTGTTTPLATYTDATGNSSNTNPVILDANGAASNATGQIWLATSPNYDLVVKTATGTTLYTISNVTGMGNVATPGLTLANIDMNNYSITTTANNYNIPIVPNGTGQTQIKNLVASSGDVTVTSGDVNLAWNNTFKGGGLKIIDAIARSALISSPRSSNFSGSYTVYLPAAGPSGAGSLLTTNDTNNAQLGWSQFGSLVPAYVSGNFYPATGLGHALGTTGTVSLTTGTLYFFPFYCNSYSAWTSINMYVTTGQASSHVVLGIYADTGSYGGSSGTITGKPTGSPISNSGAISTSGSNALATYSTVPQLQANTRYWLAATTDNSSIVFAALAAGASVTNGLGEASFTGTNSQIYGYTQAFVYGTTLPAVASLSNYTAGSALPLICLKV